MTPNVKRALLVVVICVCMVIALPGFADSNVRIVRLSAVEGSVEIDRHTGQGFEKAILNMPITRGTLLRTGEGKAEVEFEEGTVVRLAPDAQVDFQQLSLRSSGARVSTLAVDQGTVYVNYRSRKDDEFTVAVGGRDISLRKSVHFRVDVSAEEVKLAVRDGQLELAGSDGTMKVKKDETATLDFRDNGRYVLANGFAPSDYDQWDRDRENYHDTYANNSAYNSYPYYGRGDLNRYGSWYSVPGYGTMWQPYGIGATWDPFYSNGYWSYCPGFGYMYTSAYPWGWLPYRYGSWAYVPGWGWGWLPGPTWNVVAVPVLLNPPPGYYRPRPPAVTPNPGRPVPVGTIAVVNPRPRPIEGTRTGPAQEVVAPPGIKAVAPNGIGTARPPVVRDNVRPGMPTRMGDMERSQRGIERSGPAPSSSGSHQAAPRGAPATPAPRSSAPSGSMHSGPSMGGHSGHSATSSSGPRTK